MEIQEILILVAIVIIIFYAKTHMPEIYASVDDVVTGLFEKLFDAVGGLISGIGNTDKAEIVDPIVINDTGGG